jgi:hypothetical protein
LLVILVFLIIFFSAAAALCYKYGDWRNWKKYQATILFLIAGDLLHRCFTAEKHLWYYQVPFMSGLLINLLIMLIIYPCTVLIFIPMVEASTSRKIGVILVWVLIYSVLELVADYFGILRYSNGWNGWFSILFDFIMFPLLWLHYKKPIWAYAVASLIAIVVVFSFNIPMPKI